MEEVKVNTLYRFGMKVLLVCGASALSFFLAFLLGLIGSMSVRAAQPSGSAPSGKSRVVYPQKSEVDLDGVQIEGEVQKPGEFYFQHRPEEKFDSLVKRRPNFHREMLRDVVLSK